MLIPLDMFRDGRRGHLFSFADIVKARVIVRLLEMGISIQWQQKYLDMLLDVCDFEYTAKELSAQIIVAMNLRKRAC